MRRLPLAPFILTLLALRIILYALLNNGLHSLPSALCRFDCNWYIDTAITGYASHPNDSGVTLGQANWAFFPVFPLLIRILHLLPHVSAATGAVIAANAAFFVFILFAVKYLGRRAPEPTVAAATAPATAAGTAPAIGRAACVFLVAYPYSLYYSLPYTESCYAALTMLVFYLLATNREGKASAAAAIVAATRLTGVLLTPLIVLRYAQQIAAAHRAAGNAAAWQTARAALLPIAIAPLGLFLFMTYLYIHTGDAFAFLHIQAGWGRMLQDPFTVFTSGLFRFDLADTYARHGGSGTFSALCALAGILLALRLFLTSRAAEGYFLLASTLIPLSDGLQSMPRYILANPIFMVFLFDLVWTRYRKIFPEIIAACILLQLFLLHLWIAGFNALI